MTAKTYHVADVMPGEIVPVSRLPECSDRATCARRDHFESDCAAVTRGADGRIWDRGEMLRTLAGTLRATGTPFIRDDASDIARMARWLAADLRAAADAVERGL